MQSQSNFEKLMNTDKWILKFIPRGKISLIANIILREKNTFEGLPLPDEDIVKLQQSRWCGVGEGINNKVDSYGYTEITLDFSLTEEKTSKDSFLNNWYGITGIQTCSHTEFRNRSHILHKTKLETGHRPKGKMQNYLKTCKIIKFTDDKRIWWF